MTILPRSRHAAPGIVMGEARRGMSSAFSLIDAPPAPKGDWVNVNACTLSDAYISQLGESLERLASMALARKLRSPAPIDGSEAAVMVGLAGVPNTYAGQLLTDRILTASAEELGKGGIIGSISNAISSVAKTVIQPVAKLVSSAAPALKAVPGIGPALAMTVGQVANLTSTVAGGSIKSLTSGGIPGILSNGFGGFIGQGVAGVLKGGVSGLGKVVGEAVSIGGALVQGGAAVPATIAADATAIGQYVAQSDLGQWAGGVANSIGGYLGGAASSGGGMLSSIMQGGRELVNTFDNSVVSMIESANPALSGQLTSIFQGLGSEYHEFGQVFDAWSSKMKFAPTNSIFTGKIAGQLYTMVKNELGNYSVTKTPVSNAPAAVNSIPDGRLVSPMELAGYGNPVNPAGSGQPMGSDGRGMSVSPAGVSLPGGPINPDQDPTSLALLRQAANDANAGKPSAMLAGVPTWAVAGLGIAAVAMVLKRPSGPTASMGQGWELPMRRSTRRLRNKPRRARRARRAR